jgi:hypothetical protein
MNDEQQRQLKRFEEAMDDPWELCEQAGIDLINTEPTALAGIVAAILDILKSRRATTALSCRMETFSNVTTTAMATVARRWGGWTSS